MRTVVAIGIVLMCASYSWAQISMPHASLTIRAEDDQGRIVANGEASIWAHESGPNSKFVGTTDESGKMTAEMPSHGYLYYSVGGTGFYSSWGRYEFDRGSMGEDASKWSERKWSPWNPTVRVVLKRRGEAIPMFAKRMMIVPPLLDGTPVGFDFAAGDWTAPHGRGRSSDILFSATGTIAESTLNVTWSFPNKGDGIRVYPYEGGARSELRSPAQAPGDGYIPSITVDAEGRTKGQVGESRPLSFVFRSRTVLDESGKVVSAHYGKIYPEAYKIVYYFNPTANSRSLEYDSKRNMFKDVKSYARIHEP
jgi:hypothetical protein